MDIIDPASDFGPKAVHYSLGPGDVGHMVVGGD